MNNKGEWVARNYIISLILFSAVIGLCYLMIGSLATDYNNTKIVDSSFSSNYDKLSENTAVAESMLDASSGTDGFSLLDAADILLSSTFAVIKLIFGSMTTLKDQLAAIPASFGIPTQVTAIVLVTFISAIIVSIVFIVINAVNKTNKL